MYHKPVSVTLRSIIEGFNCISLLFAYSLFVFLCSFFKEIPVFTSFDRFSLSVRLSVQGPDQMLV